MAASKRTKKNTVQNTAGPKRGADGRVRGGNPGNAGGRKGRSGRKTLAFKARCEHLADTLALDLVEAQLKAAKGVPRPLADPATQFAVRYVTEYGKGKPMQAHEVTGANGGPIAHTVAVRFVKPGQA